MFSDEQLQKMNLWLAPSPFERLSHAMPEMHRHYYLPQSNGLALCGYPLQGQNIGINVELLPICCECEFKFSSYQQEK